MAKQKKKQKLGIVKVENVDKVEEKETKVSIVKTEDVVNNEDVGKKKAKKRKAKEANENQANGDSKSSLKIVKVEQVDFQINDMKVPIVKEESDVSKITKVEKKKKKRKANKKPKVEEPNVEVKSENNVEIPKLKKKKKKNSQTNVNEEELNLKTEEAKDENVNESLIVNKKVATKRKLDDKSNEDEKEAKVQKGPYVEDEEKTRRTIFVGNVPTTATREQLRKLFNKFGKVESVRLRNAVAEDPKLPRKVAAMKSQYHPKLTAITGYVVFENEDDAKKAVEVNRQVFQENYLRVEICKKPKTKTTTDESKAIFLGNLSIKISDNVLWEHFKECGEITSVRVVRDNKTGVGKGFGYVNFASEDSVHLALELDGTNIMNRAVRVKRCTYKVGGKKKEKRPLRAEKSQGKRARDKPKKPKHLKRKMEQAAKREPFQRSKKQPVE